MGYYKADLAVPELRWLGIHGCDVQRYSGVCSRFLVPLTPTDRTKLLHLAERPEVVDHPAWRFEIQSMMQSQLKAEIQCVCSADYAELLRYLDWKLAKPDLWL
ncbi:endodeoxyribonuclease [Tieghemiomyces parasiticus]|uniref:Endodeoxyribonuclease n=1 Tax=Tieghemiomyces parasiticus TaxID=78921 RepID=A0A9W7ZGB2_9FUNG|nr:endodeoxyribonuclease [Tieghemiomyces parasiticus]